MSKPETKTNLLKNTSDIISNKKFETVIESSDDSDNTKKFKRLLNMYLLNMFKLSDNMIPEFEVRFGTKKIKSISKIDFYNVIKSLLNNNFKNTLENYSLKIIPDNEFSKIRTQIDGFPNIQNYCKYNNIQNIPDMKNILFLEKDYYVSDNNKIYPLDFDDYNFRISYQIEKYYNYNDDTIQKLLANWNSTKKIFRYIKRFEFTHPEFPFLIHCSIVKTSKTNGGKFIPQFNIKDSEVFNSSEHYEIEIELNNHHIGIGTEYSTGLNIYKKLRQVIKYVLIGIQQTNYPISLVEQKEIIDNYLKITKNTDYDETKKVNNIDFIGPSSSTLQMINLINESDINETNKSISNIRNNYTVTDKADGLRKLLFINNNGKIYLINTLMDVEFTGAITEEKEVFNTIIDGEHIMHDKNGEYINLFAAFDIYYINNKNVTSLAFINLIISNTDKDDTKNTSSKKEDYRLVILKSVIKQLNPISIVSRSKSPIDIGIKKFYANNIFSGSKTILNNIKDNLFKYNTDGLIFTPANTGVASNKIGIPAPNFKITWNESFKWKPPEFNTIDFLVKFVKNDYGINKEGHLYTDGVNLTKSNQIQKYYTLILHVGFDEKKHGYINPCNDMLNDYVSKKVDYRFQKSLYKPARFYPTNPSDENAGLCNIIGIPDESNNLKIYTLEGEEIEDNIIVEFKYDDSKESKWKWIPLRVRYDKTSELRSGGKNFGNAYHVANSNWQSIHNPITEQIITSGQHIKLDNNDDDVYYNKANTQSETRSLRDFHNLYVKNMLITKLSKQGTSIIDYACGKAGDLPKWINANIEFVLGIDLNKDNIENRLDGACARYLNYAKKYSKIPKAIFINGNSSINIKNGNAFTNEKNKQIIKAIFGEGSKNEVILGKGVYNNYGIAHNGFNISSIQFALHYMFENENMLNEFLKNISQCTAIQGYFIGTCYDGNKVFNMLSNTEINKSISLIKNEKKIWEITKKYSNQSYEDDESCIGYAIDVYQETINKTFREYLVNFNYLTRLLENYGFVLLNKDEIKSLDLPGSIGYFDELFDNMQLDLKKDKRMINKIGNSLTMSDEEKQISFLNKYFIFKKIRNIDSDFEMPLQQTSIKTDKQYLEKFNEIDETLNELHKQTPEDKSKKLAEKLIDDLDNTELKSNSKKTEKIKLSINEKLQLAEQKKKEKQLQKEKVKELKEKQKQKEKEEKDTLKNIKTK
tara:strand:- start:10124 stop:13747 length:3624 start_codon:yes stop_codon:yes gene_type:complete